ncbi:SEL1-like repeat protein [Henriciella litoralis]|uniref:sel1 repeat family protein n=1 Tax=Henriciella litoralis TaxID=568102 RepID=UPI0009FC4DA4|nr:sel1 repeat family protein [Henriciella litoralis]
MDQSVRAAARSTSRAAALAVLTCIGFSSSFSASADDPPGLAEIEPFATPMERELSVSALIVFDGFLKSNDENQQSMGVDTIFDACISRGLGTACFMLGDVYESPEPETAELLYSEGCRADFPNLEACRRTYGLALERTDAGSREQDMLSEVISARRRVLMGSFSEKSDSLEDLMKLCADGSGFACTFLGDFNDNKFDKRALLSGLKAGCDATYPDAYGCHRRATLYASGAAGEKDPALALEYSKKGCELGWPDACTLFDSLRN